jgi:DNA-binding transcriptional LysR family regulator
LHVGFAAATHFQPRVPAIVRAYRERYPGVLVSPHQSNTPLLVAGLRGGEIDAAFIRPPISDGEGLAMLPLRGGPAALYSRKGGRLKAVRP